ncbi:MAG: SDR family oxidoreductase [Pseudomonadales bacterium]
MSKTVFITGASSGIGRASVEKFAAEGWNVVATMRNPQDGAKWAHSKHILVVELDVTRSETIASAFDTALHHFGTVDVLLNNAGYGAYGPLEAFDMARVERQFNTNVIGLLAVTKAVLPHFRARRSGVVINISSIGGQMTFPLGTLYHGTKFAVEGLSEALHFELAAFGAQVKIVQPGMVQTDFAGRSLDFAMDPEQPDYTPVIEKVQAAFAGLSEYASTPGRVAEVIWQAATDGRDQLRYRAGEDAEQLLDARKAQSDEVFFDMLRNSLKL